VRGHVLPQELHLVERVTRAVERGASLPVVAGALPADAVGVDGSDHWAFWQFGFPAVMITDTASLRNPHHHQPTDLPGTLDFGRFARAVAAIELGVRTLLGDEHEGV
jgi:hypothetical protein